MSDERKGLTDDTPTTVLTGKICRCGHKFTMFEPSYTVDAEPESICFECVQREYPKGPLRCKDCVIGDQPCEVTFTQSGIKTKIIGCMRCGKEIGVAYGNVVLTPRPCDECSND